MMSARVGADVKRRLDERAHRCGFSNTTQYHRALLEQQAGLDDDEAPLISPPKSIECICSKGEACPVLGLALKTVCEHRPHASLREKA